MADERLKAGDRVVTNVFAKGPAESVGAQDEARRKGCDDLRRWVRREAPDLVLCEVEEQVSVTCVDRERGEYEVAGRVYFNQCAVCGKALGSRSYDAGRGRGRAHGPCAHLERLREESGYFDAQSIAEIEARQRVDPARNPQ